VGEQAEALRARLGEFALAVVQFARGLPRELATEALIRQLTRSSGGVSANYRAACCARSRAEFVSKLSVAVEEADETAHWLWMASRLRLGPPETLSPLTEEIRQLRAILSSSLSTARRNLRRSRQVP
jgi:four helix bundle protein